MVQTKFVYGQGAKPKLRVDDPPPSYSVAMALPGTSNTARNLTSRKKSVKKDAPPSVYISLPVKISKRPEKPEKEYNPYDHRDVKNATSYMETLLHMLKGCLGTGVLAMPSAFSHSGYLLGTVSTLLVGLLSTHVLHSLIFAEYELCRKRRKPSMTYAELLEAALLEGPQRFRVLAPHAKSVANTFFVVYELGCGCVYYVFVATNIKSVADVYWPPLDLRIYMLLLLPLFVLLNWVRNLKLLAPFSSVANLLTVASFGIIASYVFSDIPPLSHRDAVAPLTQYPLYFGTVLFAMEAIGVVMTLENQMASPEKFGSTFGVLNCAMFPITLLFTSVGFFGYLKYGIDAQGSITLNLPPDQLLAQVAKLMLALAIYITHGLACYVAFDITWNQKLKSKATSSPLLWEYITRTALVFITFVFAAAIPNLQLFISLIGAFCLSTLGLSFPAIIFWECHKGLRRVLFCFKNIGIILIAVFGLVTGVSTSLIGIYNMFTEPYRPSS